MGGEVKQLDIKNRIYYFYNDRINLKNFDSKLLKIDKKHYKGINIYYIEYISQLKKLMIVKIFTVQILYICLLIMQTDILKKNMEKTLNF